MGLLRSCVDGSGNVLRSIIDIQLLLNDWRNWLNFSPELLLDSVQVESIIPVDEVNSETKVSESTRSTNAVKVGLGVFGEVEVDNNVYSLNINTASEKI